MRKHAEMIKAWADNEDLVVFHKSSERWDKVNPAWYEDATYFACLPQHAEACEHWLNGGSLQVETPIGMGAKWVDIVDYSDGCRDWQPEHFLMCKYSKHRIKVKKEKRYMGVWSVYKTTELCSTKEKAEHQILVKSGMGMPADAYIVQIEVEV